MDLLTVIVPVYNAQDYIRRCVDSILASTYTNIELLLIDDGSKDDSYGICMDYVNKDPRVRVYQKENGGMCSARNYGIDRMRGRYLAFVDNDDWVEPTMYEKLIGIIEKENVLIAESKWNEVDEALNVRQGKLKKFGKMSIKHVALGLFTDSRSVGSGYVWNSVFDYASFVKLHGGEKIYLEENRKWFEDTNFQLNLYNGVEGSIYILDEPLYNYFLRSSSFSHQSVTIDVSRKIIEDSWTNTQLYKEYASWIQYKRALGNFYNQKINGTYRFRNNPERIKMFETGKSFLEGFNMWIFSWRFLAYYYKWVRIVIGKMKK